MRLFTYWTEDAGGWVRLGKHGPGVVWTRWRIWFLPRVRKPIVLSLLEHKRRAWR